MSSHGIKDRVAIVGMGCTPFRENWDKGTDDLLIDAADRDVRVGRRHQGGHRRVLAGHCAVGHVGHHTRRAAEARGQAGDPRRELLRDGVRGVAPGQLRGGLGRLRPGDGHRRREGEGLGLPGAQRLPHPQRRHEPDAHRGGDVLARAARVRGEVRRRPRRAAARGGRDRVEEPPQRRPQPARPVPPRDGRRRDLRDAGGRRDVVGDGLRRVSPTARPPRSCAGPRTRIATPTSRCT